MPSSAETTLIVNISADSAASSTVSGTPNRSFSGSRAIPDCPVSPFTKRVQPPSVFSAKRV